MTEPKRITAPYAWRKYLGEMGVTDDREAFEWLTKQDEGVLLGSILKPIGDPWFGVWEGKGQLLTEYVEVEDED